MRLTAAAALLAAIGFSAQAADLGTLSVTSRLNEPLSARLTVNNVDPKVEPLVVRLAPEATYDRIGKKPLAADTGLELTLESKSPWVVRIKSEKPVTSRDFPLIVELNDGGKLSASCAGSGRSVQGDSSGADKAGCSLGRETPVNGRHALG